MCCISFQNAHIQGQYKVSLGKTSFQQSFFFTWVLFHAEFCISSADKTTSLVVFVGWNALYFIEEGPGSNLQIIYNMKMDKIIIKEIGYLKREIFV